MTETKQPTSAAEWRQDAVKHLELASGKGVAYVKLNPWHFLEAGLDPVCYDFTQDQATRAEAIQADLTKKARNVQESLAFIEKVLAAALRTPRYHIIPTMQPGQEPPPVPPDAITRDDLGAGELEEIFVGIMAGSGLIEAGRAAEIAARFRPDGDREASGEGSQPAGGEAVPPAGDETGGE